MIIKNNVKNEIIIKKSKFITYLYYVNDQNEINNYLKELNDLYNDSTHICYAYIINGNQKYNDDNEPKNTAGLPILEVLKKNNLNYILAVVIRYFGGIKLGSNGLIRAYSNSISEALKDNIKKEKIGYLIQINENYDNQKQIEYLLKNEKIIEKNYQEKINIQAIVSKEFLDTFPYNYNIIKETIV